MVHHRRQGDLGEAACVLWFVRCGAVVLTPVGHSPDYDLVVDDGALRRVQVKTTTQRRAGRWVVTLRTSGGNRSWGGAVRCFSPERCDVLFVVCGDGRQWCLPAGVVEGATEISLGGPKYAEHEVEASHPLWRAAGAPVRS